MDFAERIKSGGCKNRVILIVVDKLGIVEILVGQDITKSTTQNSRIQVKVS